MLLLRFTASSSSSPLPTAFLPPLVPSAAFLPHGTPPASTSQTGAGSGVTLTGTEKVSPKAKRYCFNSERAQSSQLKPRGSLQPSTPSNTCPALLRNPGCLYTLLCLCGQGLLVDAEGSRSWGEARLRPWQRCERKAGSGWPGPRSPTPECWRMSQRFCRAAGSPCWELNATVVIRQVTRQRCA